MSRVPLRARGQVRRDAHRLSGCRRCPKEAGGRAASERGGGLGGLRALRGGPARNPLYRMQLRLTAALGTHSVLSSDEGKRGGQSTKGQLSADWKAWPPTTISLRRAAARLYRRRTGAGWRRQVSFAQRQLPSDFLIFNGVRHGQGLVPAEIRRRSKVIGLLDKTRGAWLSFAGQARPNRFVQSLLEGNPGRTLRTMAEPAALPMARPIRKTARMMEKT